MHACMHACIHAYRTYAQTNRRSGIPACNAFPWQGMAGMAFTDAQTRTNDSDHKDCFGICGDLAQVAAGSAGQLSQFFWDSGPRP